MKSATWTFPSVLSIFSAHWKLKLNLFDLKPIALATIKNFKESSKLNLFRHISIGLFKLFGVRRIKTEKSRFLTTDWLFDCVQINDTVSSFYKTKQREKNTEFGFHNITPIQNLPIQYFCRFSKFPNQFEPPNHSLGVQVPRRIQLCMRHISHRKNRTQCYATTKKKLTTPWRVFPRFGRGVVHDAYAWIRPFSRTHSITESSPILLSSDKPTATYLALSSAAVFSSNS